MHYPPKRYSVTYLVSLFFYLRTSLVWLTVCQIVDQKILHSGNPFPWELRNVDPKLYAQYELTLNIHPNLIELSNAQTNYNK